MRTRERCKGRRSVHTFVQLRHDVLRHDNFKTLSGNATKLLIDIVGQYNGKNNGDFQATWSFVRTRGWRSKGTLSRALKELLSRGWIVKTRAGGKHKAVLYAVTWLSIDECDGKLQVAPTVTALNLWKDPEKIIAPYEYYIDPASIPIQKKSAACSPRLPHISTNQPIFC